ncbi:MAG: ABC transporter ATP-binding protein [Berryella intestinalis]|uniref:amino acid ABC transporter ATP-binding/permease protein n=1 Tax=Berryella intestinalis TaxID=1531429 RepID=UPI002A765915|nr:ABC transporter ATP-binding protein [Berryella intestinalis]MDY3129128.1 ABC transporter ATP-binding protein [Berryella intestinalis]
MKRASSFETVRKMLGLVDSMTGIVALACVLGILGFLCAIFIPVLAVYGGLAALGGGAFAGVRETVALLAALAVLRGVLHYLEQLCNHYIAFKLLANIRDRVFSALRRLAPAKLAGADRGNLVSMITSDVELLEVFYAHTISPVVIAVVASAIMVGFAGSIHVLFAAVALCAYLAVGLFVPVWIYRSAGDVGLEIRTRSGQLSGSVLGSLRGLREVLQFSAGDRRIADVKEQSDRLLVAQRALRGKTGAAMACTNALILMFSLGQLAVGAALYGTGAVSGEGVIVATTALFSSFGPVVALANLGTTLQGTLASGQRVIGILEEEPLVEENETGADIEFDGASVERVGFSYGGERVLRDVSIDIPRGRVVGISGKSGSGKSTLCRLLMRFWDVDEGRVALSGRSVRDIRTASLRDAEAFVEQDTHLFHDSIRDNLLIARPDATQDQIEAACRAASVHDFIMSLPDGYDTMVGELGDTLSGGERQRLGLARAFLHDAPFLLLDEPTSNLDSLNEAAILKSIDEQRGKRTVVLISHRASTMGVADRVVSMDSGRVS